MSGDREPTLEDTRQALEGIVAYTEKIDGKVELLNAILDQNMRLEAIPRKVEMKADSPNPALNLRFDMPKLATMATEHLLSIEKGLESLENKFRNRGKK